MSVDEYRTDNANESSDISDEFYRILTLIDNRCNNGTARIKRENVKTVDSDDNEKTLIRYIEFDDNGNEIKETYCSESGLEKLIDNTSLSVESQSNDIISSKSTIRSPETQQTSIKNVQRKEKSKKGTQDIDDDCSASRKVKADNFFKHFVFVIVPIAAVLTVMLIGQNYIKSRSDEKIRLLSIETVPLSDEETSTKLLININTANSTELTFLPGIGESKAKKIIDYREENGSFESVEEIMSVNGIGESTFENIKPYITVND